MKTKIPPINTKRDAVLIHAKDAQKMGLQNGDRVQLTNDIGTFVGTLVITDVARQTLQVYWPEGNVLLDPKKRSDLAKIPAYKAGRAFLSRADESVKASVEVNV